MTKNWCAVKLLLASSLMIWNPCRSLPAAHRAVKRDAEASRGGGPPQATKAYGAKLPEHYKGICGMTGVKPTLKAQFMILNGTCEPYGANPWTVQIQVRNSLSERTYFHSCGGTILTEDFILTAAHCFE